MKLSSYTTYSETDIYLKARNEKWNGNGTPEDPFIIESTHSFPDKSVIKNTPLHIIIKNCTFTFLSLNRCKNLKFVRCTFDFFGLSKSSKIKIEHCSFKDTLEMRACHDLYVQDSYITFLIFSMCYENYFKTCTITKIYNNFSRANIFENIDTSIDLNIIMGSGWKTDYLKYIPFIGVGAVSLVSAILIFSYNLSETIMWSLIIGLILMGCFAILIPTALYLDHKKMQDYPDNQIF